MDQTSNTWAWVIGVIIVLIVIGGIWWWASGSNTTNTSNTTNSGAAGTIETGASATGAGVTATSSIVY